VISNAEETEGERREGACWDFAEPYFVEMAGQEFCHDGKLFFPREVKDFAGGKRVFE
jgi:hypothetical protein